MWFQIFAVPLHQIHKNKIVLVILVVSSFSFPGTQEKRFLSRGSF